jgi:hypothetical protein
MKFRIKYSDGAHDQWEDYNKNVPDPEVWAKDTIEYFNSTLRPGEKPRTLLAVEIQDTRQLQHEWVKRTDGMSVLYRGGCVDNYYCEVCGITGKRTGLSTIIVRDYKWRAKKYELCIAAADAAEKEKR